MRNMTQSDLNSDMTSQINTTLSVKMCYVTERDLDMTGHVVTWCDRLTQLYLI